MLRSEARVALRQKLWSWLGQRAVKWVLLLLLLLGLMAKIFVKTNYWPRLGLDAKILAMFGFEVKLLITPWRWGHNVGLKAEILGSALASASAMILNFWPWPRPVGHNFGLAWPQCQTFGHSWPWAVLCGYLDTKNQLQHSIHLNLHLGRGLIFEANTKAVCSKPWMKLNLHWQG